MKSITLLGALLLLAREGLASPQNLLALEACCCCEPGKNVISCDTEIKAKDCVCLAVMCPKGAPTVWAHKTKRPQATSTTTLSPADMLSDAGPSAATALAFSIPPDMPAEAEPWTATALATSIPAELFADGPLTHGPNVADATATAGWPMAATAATEAPSPTAGAAPTAAVGEGGDEGWGWEEYDGQGAGNARGGRKRAVPTLPVTPEDSLEGSTELAPCCCCDLRSSKYHCQMRTRGDCFCVEVVCPSPALSVWTGPRPTAKMTQRIGTVW